MAEKPNAIYIMGGGGTGEVSASAYGLINQTHSHYRDDIGTFYAAVGGMRGTLYEELTDVFRWAESDGKKDAASKLNRIKFPASPIFGTSRHKPDDEDCERILDVFKAHNIYYAFLNGGNDTMEKARILEQFAQDRDYELHIIGIPKTVDNDLLVTHRSPGYASFAKQVAINTMGLQADLDSFGYQPGAIKHGPIKEGGVAQVVVFMGRDQGWGAAASIVGKIDESYGPHAILTKEGGFDETRFLDRSQNAWDNGNLLVTASEGAFDTESNQYLGNQLQVLAYDDDLLFKVHRDPHQNTSVTDSRVAMYLKLLLEKKLGIDTNVYNSFKVREEGPAYLNRDHLEIMSAVDFQDAIAVGERAADLAFGGSSPVDGVMVTLTRTVGETCYTLLENVANPDKGSKAMTKSLDTLDTAERPILSPDGMMIDRELFMNYIGEFIDLNGPNRREVLKPEGFKLPLERIVWDLVEKRLPAYERIA